ncbi:hypothetical protein DES39_1936 [Orbus hercynius]|uniref:DUF721 domain-containing protein n=1 Tax=Orbus hercynius TaxID=593135 RepID=A0A495RBL4_9GAMM|nr:DciA family protein [Orbus hercynius]RKS84721.1 hypothetical protein DES39_1936 [Orbus hercynius]
MRKSVPQAVNNLFNGSTFLTIQERSVALSRLNHLLAQHIPHALYKQCRIANYRQGVLIIEVSSASWLTRLRYEQEKLRSLLRQNGLSGLSSIQFKINPELNANKLLLNSGSNSIPSRVISPESAKHLLILADSCPPKLKNNLIKLANHVTKMDNKKSK